jgi:hypothetical protein
MHRNSPTAMQSSKNFPGVTPGTPLYGRERRRRGGELQLHGFSLPKIVEPQCQMLNCIVQRVVKKFFSVDAVI